MSGLLDRPRFRTQLFTAYSLLAFALAAFGVYSMSVYTGFADAVVRLAKRARRYRAPVAGNDALWPSTTRLRGHAGLPTRVFT